MDGVIIYFLLLGDAVL